MVKVLIQDIADRLGLSKSTVSLILNGKAKEGRICEATCKKVLEAAAEMRYQPNEIARSLSTGKTRSIGVVVTDISNEFFGYLTYYIQKQARKYGYCVIVANSNENLDDFNEAVATLLNRQTDGILLVPVDGGEDTAKRIADRNVPLVQVDRYYPDLAFSYVIVNNYESSVDATEKLIKKGCRRIAVVCYGFQNTLIERKQGCVDTLKRHGLLDNDIIKDIDFANQEEDIRQAILDLKNCKEKVDAIFFCSRRVFTNGLKYISQEGIRIPEDMQLFCFDRMDLFSIMNVPINYIEQPVQEIAEQAVDILMEKIKSPTGETMRHQRILKTRLCIN